VSPCAQNTPHGGTFCQESVVTCPGDLEIAGATVVLAFSQLPCFGLPRGRGSSYQRPKRSLEETLAQEGSAISARSRWRPSGRLARTNELDVRKRRPMIAGAESLCLVVDAGAGSPGLFPGGGAQVWRSGLTSTHSAARMWAAMTV